MNNILVPTDFSTEAKNALDFAVQVAKKTEAKLKLLHVIELPSSSFNVMGEVQSESTMMEEIYNMKLIEKTKEEMQNLVNQVQNEGVVVSSKLELGNIYKHIYKEIDEEKTDLIIMGSAGAGGFKELFVGSNTEKVIRHSHVPVITIKEKTDLNSIKNMVYATDFGKNQSVELAKYLQGLLGLKMHLLKVYNSNSWAFTKESAMKELEKFADEAQFEDYSLSVIDAPFIEDGILEFATKVDADFIVMGTHGYTGIPHLLWGSRAEAVANHSKKPVLTVKVD